MNILAIHGIHQEKRASLKEQILQEYQSKHQDFEYYAPVDMGTSTNESYDSLELYSLADES